jgi:5-carboxymethyl-2-hydroxymuconate isomerase
MPHLIVEYSSNLEKQLDMRAVLKTVHDAAIESGMFPFGGIRTRAERRDHYIIADAHPDNGFIHIQARIGTGRTPEARQKAGAHIFAALKRVTAEHFAKHPLSVSFEFCEIDPIGAGKHNNVHDYVKKRGTHAAS